MNATKEEALGAVGFATMVGRAGDTCVAMGIGDLPIIAPSHLLSLMESATIAALTEILEPSETTYLMTSGMEVIDSAPMGIELRSSARLDEIDGKEMIFLCDVFDGDRHIARGRIKRKAVERVSFLARTAARELINE